MISVVLGKYLRACFIIFSSFLLINMLSISEFGEFIFFNSILLFLTAFLVGPAPTLFTQYFSNEDYAFKDIYIKGIRFLSLSSFLAIAVYFLIIKFLKNPLIFWDIELLIIGIFIFIFNSISLIIDTFYRSKMFFKFSEGTKVIEAVIWFFGILSLYYFDLLSIKNILILFLIRSFFVLSIFSFNLIKIKKSSHKSIKKILFFSDFSSLYLNTFFAYVIQQSTQLMLGFLSNPTQLAYYGFSYIFYTILVMFPGAISWYLLSRTNDKIFFENENYIKFTSVSYFLCVVAASAIFVLAPIIISLFKGDDYFESIKIVKMLVLCFVIYSPQYLLSSFWIYHKKYNALSIITTVVGLINIILNFFIIPKFGAYGATFTLLISFTIGTILNLLLLNTLKHKEFSLAAYFLPKSSYLKEFIFTTFEYIKKNKKV